MTGFAGRAALTAVFGTGLAILVAITGIIAALNRRKTAIIGTILRIFVILADPVAAGIHTIAAILGAGGTILGAPADAVAAALLADAAITRAGAAIIAVGWRADSVATTGAFGAILGAILAILDAPTLPIAAIAMRVARAVLAVGTRPIIMPEHVVVGEAVLLDPIRSATCISRVTTLAAVEQKHPDEQR